MGSCFSADETHNEKGKRHSRNKSRHGGDQERHSSHAIDGDSGSSFESEARGGSGARLFQKNLTQDEIDNLFFDPKKASWLGAHIHSPNTLSEGDASESEGRGTVGETTTLTEVQPAESKAVEILPEKDELRLISWYHFLAECPQAVVAVRSKWLSITGQELDPRVTAYCSHKQLNDEQSQDRWRRYVIQQLVVERRSTGTCICDIDDAYFRVVATLMVEGEGGESSLGGNNTGSVNNNNTGTTGDLGTPRDNNSGVSNNTPPETGTHRNPIASTSNLPNLPELYNRTITGDLFEALMKEVGITTECHLMYLFSRLLVHEAPRMASPIGSPRQAGSPSRLPSKLTLESKQLVRMSDQWSIALPSWRLGWLLLGCGGSLGMQHKVELMKKEFDLMKVQDQDFSKMYLFLWSFANSDNMPPTANASPVNSSRNTPEVGMLSPPGTVLPPLALPLMPQAGSLGGTSSPSNRKMIPKDDAISIWTTVVGTKWEFTSQWCMYCEDKNESIGAKSYISLDQWKQLLEFMPLFTNMAHFQEYDGATSSWPGVLDDFADWMQRRSSQKA